MRDTSQKKFERVPGQIAFSLGISRSVLLITVTKFTSLGSWEHLAPGLLHQREGLAWCHNHYLLFPHELSMYTEKTQGEGDTSEILCVSSQSALLSSPGDGHVLGTHVGA